MLKNKEDRNAKIYGLLAIFLISIFASGTVLYLVFYKLKKLKQLRPSNLLVAHLAVLAVGSATCLLNTSDKNFFAIPESLCSTIGYAKSVLYVAYFSNVFAIAYERLNFFRESCGTLKIGCIILRIWAVSLVFSIPSAFTTVSKTYYLESLDGLSTLPANQTLGNCKAVNLLGSPIATTVFESLRFLLFSVCVVIYMLHAVVKIRSILKYLQTSSVIPTERMASKLRSVRFIYFHFVSFILVSVPAGIMIFARRVLTRAMVEMLKETFLSANMWDASTFIFSTFTLLYYCLNPLISIILLEGKQIWCCSRNARQVEENLSLHSGNANSDHAHQNANTGRRRNIFGNSSRFSTVGFTTGVEGSLHDEVNVENLERVSKNEIMI